MEHYLRPRSTDPIKATWTLHLVVNTHGPNMHPGIPCRPVQRRACCWLVKLASLLGVIPGKPLSTAACRRRHPYSAAAASSSRSACSPVSSPSGNPTLPANREALTHAPAGKAKTIPPTPTCTPSTSNLAEMSCPEDGCSSSAPASVPFCINNLVARAGDERWHHLVDGLLPFLPPFLPFLPFLFFSSW